MNESLKCSSIPTSFVRTNMKLLTDKGSGESKFYVGSAYDKEKFDDFFQFYKGYTYTFDKENLIEYMLQVKLEYVYQKFNKYRNAGLKQWNEFFAEVKALKSLRVNLQPFVESKRYYIRSYDSDIFKDLLRKIAVPRLTDLVFVKDSDAKTIKIYVEVNYAYEEIEGGEEQDFNNLGDEEVDGATNRLFYGVPGCGKSFTVDNKIKEDGIDKNVRVVFHPDYTYYDFVGQISPRVEVEGEESKVKYVFNPGPFTQILKYACDNRDKRCLLIIEELNRGNAPAIFGELFQLLDRSEEAENLGESRYGVTNFDIAEYVYGDREHEVKIPSNLSIYATMNTSDQNVFTLDTAFQRRWFMNHIPNKFEGAHAAQIIDGTKISWGAFATVINDRLHEELGSLCSNEDKSLGAYFATDADLKSKERFSEKVLKYLWDDAFKMSREAIFSNECKCLGDVIEGFQEDNKGLSTVLQESVYDDMVKANSKFASNVVDAEVEAP